MNLGIRGRSVGELLTAAVLATYALIALGATVAMREADCGGWPLCGQPLTVDGLAVFAHRGAALLAFGLVCWTAIAALRTDLPSRVRWLLVAAAIAFFGQIGLGAAVALGTPVATTELHLGVAVAIFAVLVYTLVVALEAETPASDDGPLSVEEPDSHSSVATEAPTTSVESTPPSDVAAEEHGNDSGGIREIARAYLTLTKPRLMWLLCLLAVAGMALAALAGTAPTGVEVVATLAGGVLAIGASGVANHVLERDRDERMERTSDRPLVRDHVSVRGAVTFCTILAIGALAIPWVFVSGLVAGLICAAMVYYGIVYTVLLKPNTRWSTLIGGGSGALPAVIGWAAGAGSIDPPAIALAGIVVLWTPAHFYNLALAYREDYARGGFPLVPVVNGPATARRRIVGYLAATLLAASVLGAMTDLGGIYAVATAVGAAVFLVAVVRSFREQTDAAALRAFYASNAFLGIVLVAIVVEVIV